MWGWRFCLLLGWGMLGGCINLGATGWVLFLGLLLGSMGWGGGGSEKRGSGFGFEV